MGFFIAMVVLAIGLLMGLTAGVVGLIYYIAKKVSDRRDKEAIEDINNETK